MMNLMITAAPVIAEASKKISKKILMPTILGIGAGGGMMLGLYDKSEAVTKQYNRGYDVGKKSGEDSLRDLKKEVEIYQDINQELKKRNSEDDEVIFWYINTR